MKVVGIDLAGVETRPTGFCVLDLKSMEVSHFILYKDNEILEAVERVKPVVVAIDAPLSLPIGRESLEEKSNIHLRECDRELLTRKIKFFPVTLGPMRKLTHRGMKLKKRIECEGFQVIEVYPGGAQDILGIPRKSDAKGLMKSLLNLGLKGIGRKATHDELDAVTAAYVAKLYIENNYEAYGNKEEGQIIMPKHRES